MKYEKIIICVLSILLIVSLVFTGIGWYGRNKYMGQYRELSERLRESEQRARRESEELARGIAECTVIAGEIGDGFNRQANTIRELRDAIQQARAKFEELENRLYHIKCGISYYDSDNNNNNSAEIVE